MNRIPNENRPICPYCKISRIGPDQKCLFFVLFFLFACIPLGAFRRYIFAPFRPPHLSAFALNLEYMESSSQDQYNVSQMTYWPQNGTSTNEQYPVQYDYSSQISQPFTGPCESYQSSSATSVESSPPCTIPVQSLGQRNYPGVHTRNCSFTKPKLIF